MSRVRVTEAISLDGFGAGPRQSLEHPLGEGGMALHKWAVVTKFFQESVAGNAGGETGIDDDFARRGQTGFGARIMGRNMFGPVRGPWPDESWQGWWGPNPPYHTPVFVLTHHPRPSLTMEGGTVFHFVTGTPPEVLARAREVAGGKDVQICGGVSTVRAYLSAGLVDELHLAISPVLLGTGEHLLRNIDLVQQGFKVTERVSTPKATHVVLTKG